ncbi:MAG: sulfotransferase [Myxococcota bacterium]|nr:sulfotransferase [Myxococcota bacterium]
MRLRPNKLAREWRRKRRMAAAWLRSRRLARAHAAAFAEVERFVLFVGYPRSGHSLVGSLLDAHPEAIVAHELHVLRYLRYGFSRDQLFALLLERSARQAARGRSATGYDYRVPGQWQGRARRLRLIGDKRGGGTIRKLTARPGLLPLLERRVALPIRWVHVVRNPFDNVATIFRRGESRTLEGAADHYLRMVEGVVWFRERVAAETLIDLRHEEILSEPRRELVRLCGFLGLEPEPDYLDACAGAVWKEPRRTREAVDWPDAVRGRLEREIAAVSFLRGYRFD